MVKLRTFQVFLRSIINLVKLPRSLMAQMG